MLIEFEKIDQQVLNQFKGGTGEFCLHAFDHPACRIMKGSLEPGASIGMHTHETNSEVIYILSGSGKVLYDDGQEMLSAGSCHYCPMGHAHSLMNTGSEKMTFFAVVPQC